MTCRSVCVFAKTDLNCVLTVGILTPCAPANSSSVSPWHKARANRASAAVRPNIDISCRALAIRRRPSGNTRHATLCDCPDAAGAPSRSGSSSIAYRVFAAALPWQIKVSAVPSRAALSRVIDSTLWNSASGAQIRLWRIVRTPPGRRNATERSSISRIRPLGETSSSAKYAEKRAPVP